MYFREEIGASYEFAVNQEGQLIAKHPVNGEVTFKLMQEDFFISQVSYLAAVQFLRDENSEVVGCEFSGQNAHKVWFKKNQCR